jgi:hypothetical protein
MRATLRLAAAAAVTIALLSAPNARAGVILSPSAIISNSLGEQNSSFQVANLINQSGLSAGFISGTTDFSTYLAGTPTHLNPSSLGNGGWASQSGTTSGTIVFDLGAVYTLHRMALWNDEDSQAIGGFALVISNDLSFATSTSLGSFSAVVSPNDPVAAQVFDLSDASCR